MIRRYLGLDFLDLVIQLGATIALAIVASSLASPHEEVGGALVVAASFGLLAWRRARGLAELRHQATGEERDAADRIAELEQRVAELEYSQTRLLDLEERVDFNERLLVRQRDEGRLIHGERDR
jgi:hypothetical protein